MPNCQAEQQGGGLWLEGSERRRNEVRGKVGGGCHRRPRGSQQAFTMSEPEAVEVFGLSEDSFGFWEVSG